MMWTILFLLFSVFLVYVAHLFNVTVPEEIHEKWKYRRMGAVGKLMMHVSLVHDYLYPGTLSHAQFIRKFLKRLIMMASGESLAPDVELKKEVFEGVNVHVYIPPEMAGKSDLLRGFVYLHGGGLTVHDTETYDGLTRQISKALGAVVVSIDFRPTPEYTFPIPYEDSFRATKWFLQHADQYGVDPNRIAIGGDSAGGYLTATVAQGILDDAETPNLKLQVLVYPWLQMLDLNTPSHQIHRNAMLPSIAMALYSNMLLYGTNVTMEIMQAFMTNNHTSIEFRNSALFRERFSHSLVPSEMRSASSYTPPTHGTSVSGAGQKIWEECKDIFLDPRSCPFLGKDLSGLPTTYVATVEFDPLRDDGVMYAKLLEQVGVEVTWRHYDHAMHGMLWMGPGIVFEEGRQMLADMLEFVNLRL